MPIDWKTPYGYLGAVFLYLPMFYILFRMGTLLATLSGLTCGIMTAFSKDIRQRSTTIDEKNKLNSNGTKVMDYVYSVAEFHGIAKQLR